MNYIFIGGMNISYDILESLCLSGEIPEIAFSYDHTLRNRSNYKLLNPLGDRYGFKVINTSDINGLVNLELMKICNPDWIFAFGWSQLLNMDIINIPKFGALGLHPSKLPEGRGRATIPWNLIKGFNEGCVSIFQIDQNADNGPIVAQQSFEIKITDDSASILQKVTAIAKCMIIKLLPALNSGDLSLTIQDEAKTTYWAKRTPDDGLIDWDQQVVIIYNLIRGVTAPFPGAFGNLQGKKIILWRAGYCKIALSMDSGKIIGPYIEHGNDANCGLSVAAKDGIIIAKNIEINGEILTGSEIIQFAVDNKGKVFDDE